MVKNKHELAAEMTKHKEELSQQEKAELARNLTAREWIEHKLKTDIIQLELPSDIGARKFGFRKLSPVDYNKLSKLQMELAAAGGDLEKTKEPTEKIYQMLEDLSLDEGLNKEFWEAGTGYSPDILATILIHIKRASISPSEDYLAQINSFRPV
jgi:hypothetical protein